MAPRKKLESLDSPKRYTVAWIAALPHERAAATAVLDEEHDTPANFGKLPHDPNQYTWGSIGNHHVVITSLPSGVYGTTAAGSTANQLLSSLPHIRFGLMVGIGAGVPQPNVADVRLGDVVVSKPDGSSGGVIQHDLIKIKGGTSSTGHLAKPPMVLLHALAKLQSDHLINDSVVPSVLEAMLEKHPKMKRKSPKDPGFTHPGADSDRHFAPWRQHVGGADCANCPEADTISRDRRDTTDPEIHYGVIASGNALVKNANERDEILKRLPDNVRNECLCIETEAAGLMGTFPCIVIRGICDYADSHKNDVWQKYAAATAAAFAKEFLSFVDVQEVERAPELHKAVEKDRFNVPFSLQGIPLVEKFVGRDEQLHQIERKLQPASTEKSGRKVFVIHGLGGIGKTQLAVKYARNHQDEYSAVIWVDGSTRDRLQQSFLDAAKQIPREQLQVDVSAALDSAKVDVQAVMRDVLQWLSLPSNWKWLLVIDNADREFRGPGKDEQGFDPREAIPDSDHGSILITSRLSTLQEIGETLPLGRVNESEAKEILELQAGQSLQDIHLLIIKLNGLPLALTQAGAFIGRTGVDVQTYIDRFDRTWSNLMEKQDQFPLQGYGERSMLTTWKLSYDQVSRKSETAAWLLKLWAFLFHEGLWYGLLATTTRPAGDAEDFDMPVWLAKLAGSELEFSSAMNLLEAYSLAETQGSGSYAMHPILHKWIRSLSLDTEANSLQFISIRILGNAAPSENDGVFWKSERRLLRHALHASSGLRGSQMPVYEELTAWALHRLGTLFARHGKLEEAEWMYHHALAGKDVAFGDHHPSTLRTMNNLGVLYRSQGKLQEAEQMYQRAMAGYEKALGPNHATTLEVVKNLAVLYRIQGRPDEAKQMQQRAYFLTTSNEEIIQPDSTDTSSVTRGWSQSNPTTLALGGMSTGTPATSVTNSGPLKPLNALIEDVVSPPSVASSTSTLRLTGDEKRLYAQEFTENLWRALEGRLEVGMDTSSLELRFTGDLQKFSKMLRNAGTKADRADRADRKASMFFRNERLLIAGKFFEKFGLPVRQEIVSESGSVESTDSDGSKDQGALESRNPVSAEVKRQLVEDWTRADPGDYENVAVPTEVAYEYNADDPRVSWIPETRETLTSSLPWKWLVSRLSSALRLSWPDQAFEDIVTDLIVNNLHSNPTKDNKLSCKVQWDPIGFLDEESPLGQNVSFEQVLVTTGWEDMVQTTTCGDYVERTWPLYGLHVLSVVEEAIRSNSRRGTCQLEEDVYLQVEVVRSNVCVECTGPVPILVQIVSQVAWLGAACSPSPKADRFCYSSPRIASLQQYNGSTQLDIRYSIKYPGPLNKHSCWRILCSGANIASGFPIRARDNHTQGLELPVEAMILLGGTDYATIHNGHFMLKGLSTMFLPMSRCAQGVLWHFIKEAGGPLSYSNDEVMKADYVVPDLDVDCLYTVRHFVGWVPEAEILTGTASATYEIDEAKTDPPGSNLVLEKATITCGKIVGGSATFGMGHHRNQIHNATGQVGFRVEVSQLRDMYVVLFDTSTRQGWLVDGVSALLHITCTQLRSQRFLGMCDRPNELVIKYAQHQRGGDDAFETICKLRNEELPLWEEFDKRTTSKKKLPDGTLVGEPEQLYKTWSLQDQIRENIQTLSKIFAHQARPPSGVDIRFTNRMRLEGWSFRDAVDRPTLMEPKTVHIDGDSAGWVQYIRQFHAATLLGAGFGELMKPRRQGLEPPCCAWHKVPVGRDLLTTSYATLREIAKKRGASTHFPNRVTSDLQWHQPDSLFGPDCSSSAKGPQCNRVQELLPLKVLGSVTEPKMETNVGNPAQPEAYPAAVIFGRSHETSFKWPEILDPRSYLKARANEDPVPKMMQPLGSSNAGQSAAQSTGEHDMGSTLSMSPNRSGTSTGDQRTNTGDDHSGSTSATEVTPVHSRSTIDDETSRPDTATRKAKPQKPKDLFRWLANKLHVRKTVERQSSAQGDTEVELSQRGGGF